MAEPDEEYIRIAEDLGMKDSSQAVKARKNH